MPCQEMQGFDATSKLAPDFQLTPFYEDCPADFATWPVGASLKAEDVAALEGALAWRVADVCRPWGRIR